MIIVLANKSITMYSFVSVSDDFKSKQLLKATFKSCSYVPWNDLTSRFIKKSILSPVQPILVTIIDKKIIIVAEIGWTGLRIDLFDE